MSVTLFGPPNAHSPRECRVERTTSYGLVSLLVRAWHSTLPTAPPGFRLAFVVYAPNLAPVAVAMWGRPTARNEDQTTTLELTRLAHAPGAPRNVGSWALACMRRYIRQNMPEIKRLISYQNADVHDGALYKADNWQLVSETFKDHTWHTRPGRKGTEVQHKVKWEWRL